MLPLLCFIWTCVHSHLCCHYWVGRVGGGLLRGGVGYFGGGFRALRGGLLWGGLLQGYFQNRLRWVTSGFKIKKGSALRADNSFFMSFRRRKDKLEEGRVSLRARIETGANSSWPLVLQVGPCVHLKKLAPELRSTHRIFKFFIKIVVTSKGKQALRRIPPRCRPPS